MKQRIVGFLGVYVPEIDVNDAKITFFDEAEVEKEVWEKPPQLYIEKVVLAQPKEGKAIALGTVTVTERMCEGHFPFFKMLPLAILAQAAGQVGELLILCLNKRKGDLNCDKVPLAIEVLEVRSMSNEGGTKQRKFIIPGDRLLVFMTYLGGKFGIHKVRADIYLEDGIMASIGNVTYFNVELKDFMEARNEESLVKPTGGFCIPVSEGSQAVQGVA